MSGQTILISGLAHRVAIAGALLSQRWRGEGQDLILVPEGEQSSEAQCLLRPDMMGFHAEIGLAPDVLLQNASAEPVFAPEYSSSLGSVQLPFAAMGPSQFGVDFHHFWMRAKRSFAQSDLFDFSAAVALQNAVRKPDIEAIVKSGMPFGLAVDRQKYTEILLELAMSGGAKIAQSSEAAGAQHDLRIACDGSLETGWFGKTIGIPKNDRLSGMDCLTCANAARRFVGLSASLNDCDAERQEYTRLAHREADRVADFETLLMDEDPTVTQRPALRRKINVFAACGKIPTEDFEVFSSAEWLAALWVRGFRPRRYDRLVHNMPEAKLTNWMETLRRQVEAVVLAGEVA